MTVELRAYQDRSDLLEASLAGRGVGLVRFAVTGSVLQAAADLYETAGTTDAREFVDAMLQRSEDIEASELQLQAASILLRHEARMAGLAGGLREPLRHPVGRAFVDTGTARATFHGEGEALAERLVATLCGWGLEVSRRRPSGPLRQLSRKLAGGVGVTVGIVVMWEEGRSFTMSIPARPDLMPEAVGCCADTTSAVLRRFPEHANAVRSISFDRSERGLATDIYSGVANAAIREIHLNIGYVTADELVAMAHRMAARRQPPFVPGFVSTPLSSLDRTTAHECWHQIETAVLAKDYRVGFEMRRRLGECLGVETLEQAIKGNEKGSPPAWQEAHRRLANDVSDYATTSPVEATAELFKEWWSRRGELTPVVACFGDLVDELIPP